MAGILNLLAYRSSGAPAPAAHPSTALMLLLVLGGIAVVLWVLHWREGR